MRISCNFEELKFREEQFPKLKVIDNSKGEIDKLTIRCGNAVVLLRSCLDVLDTHNEPIIKRLCNDIRSFIND